MKFIFVNSKNASKPRVFDLSSRANILFLVILFGGPLSIGAAMGFKVAEIKWESVFQNTLAEMQLQIVAQREAIDDNKSDLEDSLRAMTVNLAQLRYRLVRLDALGEQLIDVASLEQREFNFSQDPGLGGPEGQNLDALDSSVSMDKYSKNFAELEFDINAREAQLGILEKILTDKNLKTEQTIAGKPIKRGWMSSDYGMRTDPFHGKKQWHAGVDFAGRKGDDILAVGSGIVTWSGEKSGYGLMVEISHNDGFVTRYAHNDKNIVELGSIVKKGQVVAKMGSSGRSTGPHVHFEVHKNGRTVDPSSYINRTIR